jgi:hypothetical protein
MEVTDTHPLFVAGRVYAVAASVTDVAIATADAAGVYGWKLQPGIQEQGSAYYGLGTVVGMNIFWFGPEARAFRWPVTADGSLGAWRPVEPPPLARADAFRVPVSIGRRVYMVGQSHQSQGRNDVDFAELRNDDTLGAWTATEPFPVPRYDHEAVAWGSFVYVLGGRQVVSDVPVLDVSVTRARPDGSLEGWKTTTRLPEWHRYSYAVIAP